MNEPFSRFPATERRFNVATSIEDGEYHNDRIKLINRKSDRERPTPTDQPQARPDIVASNTPVRKRIETG
jgi:hypothetical protein